jgi:dihydroxyacid dehydratase/phosphogluconate dehydratase
MVYGGTIAPGHYNGQDLNIVSAFEALGQKIAGQLNENDFKEIVKRSCLALAPAVECIQPIRWQQLSKHWE